MFLTVKVSTNILKPKDIQLTVILEEVTQRIDVFVQLTHSTFRMSESKIQRLYKHNKTLKLLQH